MRAARIFLLAVLVAGCPAPYPHVPPAPPKKYVEAEANLRRGHFVEAAAGFREFLKESKNPTYHARAYYRLAQAEYALGSYEQTLDTLSELRNEFPAQKGPQVPALQGDAHYGLGRRNDAILKWEQAWTRGTKADREILRPRIEKAIGELDPESARNLAAAVTAPEIQDMLALHEPSIILPEGTTLARETDDEYDDERPDSARLDEERPDAAALDEEPQDSPEPLAVASIEEPDRQPDALAGERLGGSIERVACLLQLTGPDKAYGWRALNGLRLAFDDQPDVLAVRDTGGDPQTAAQLLRRLAADPTVLAVVGPQRSAESEAIAPLAEELGLPVLLLSQREGLGGRAVLQAGVTQRQQASTVVDYASARLNVTRFAVVYPDDGYGKSFLDAFGAEVQARGGTLVGRKPYAPGSRDFASEIAAVRGWIASSGLQAVFIPDAAPTATALATALRQMAPDLVLLGSESWNDAPLIAQAGSAIDGAVFVDTFHAAGGGAGTEAFVSRFRARAGTAPTVFEAQAFDAGMLVRRAIEQGASTRADLLAQLRAAGTYEGAGRLSAGPQGFQRELILLRAHQGSIERVEPTAG